ncbi:unnamed protein product [Spirodela intermedia]|uniref:Sas10 C-terminal domain-containing protein n=1 Tax=Spirodela intermedia TaxID=51605 RepID=A0A7I8JXT1_SPIIN|nr:unnamed protein product [Spirodela intermedia]
MARGGGRQKKGIKNSKFSNRLPVQKKNISFGEENMDDEIDAFHKQRDMIPFDKSHDTDEDEEQPVFDFEGLHDDSDDTDASDGDASGHDDEIGRNGKDYEKMVKQKKILQKKYGGVEDDMSDDSEQEEKRKASFGRGKQFLYGADNIDFEIQSDEEDLAEEEAIAVMSQKEKAKSLSMEDFGLEDVDEEESDDDNQEKSLQNFFAGKRPGDKSDVFGSLEDEAYESYEEVKKDINALTKEEQMDVVYSSAPELVGLLSELNEALDQFYRLKPLLHKAKDTKGLNYFETKQKLLLAYIQAISFYLLLKTEGHPVRDHPVIAHLVELKNLWEKVKNMDITISPLVEIISKDDNGKVAAISVEEEKDEPALGSAVLTVPPKSLEATDVSESTENGSSKEDSLPKQGHQKHQDGQVGHQSLQMLKVRALLEQKLKEKGIFDSFTANSARIQNEASKRVNRQMETLADFDDATDGGVDHGKNGKLNKHVSTKVKRPTLASGDDDLPKRENIGEKRRKYDHRVLARSGAGSLDDDDRAVRSRGTDDDTETDLGQVESEDEDPVVPSSIETEADGKRQITYQLKHEKAVVRRKGQVRDIRKPAGPYGGEASGINTRVSRSIRFKS